MPRKIGENVRNELKIHDPISGSDIILYYRTPTSEERIAYGSAMFDRDQDKVRIRITEARQELGMRILEGFRDGDFTVPGPDGEVIALSVESYPDWKEQLKKYASDLIELMAAHVFEGARITSSQGEVYTEKN